MDPEFWQFGMTLFAHGAVAPWLSLVDDAKFQRHVDGIQNLGIQHARVVPQPGAARRQDRRGVRDRAHTRDGRPAAAARPGRARADRRRDLTTRRSDAHAAAVDRDGGVRAARGRRPRPSDAARHVGHRVRARHRGRPNARRKVGELFDSLAPTWKERDGPERHASVLDALDRGGPFPTRRVHRSRVGCGCRDSGAGRGVARRRRARPVVRDARAGRIGGTARARRLLGAADPVARRSRSSR